MLADDFFFPNQKRLTEHFIQIKTFTFFVFVYHKAIV